MSVTSFVPCGVLSLGPCRRRPWTQSRFSCLPYWDSSLQSLSVRVTPFEGGVVPGSVVEPFRPHSDNIVYPLPSDTRESLQGVEETRHQRSRRFTFSLNSKVTLLNKEISRNRNRVHRVFRRRPDQHLGPDSACNDLYHFDWSYSPVKDLRV